MFRNWFRKKSPAPEPQPPEYETSAALMTDIGCHRAVNQDSGRIVRPADAASLASKGVLVAVADGMGGHHAGEVASQQAIEIIARSYYDLNADPADGLAKAFEQANRSIYEQSRTDESWHGMGTTCTALVLRGGSAYAAHVGDSRLYLIRGGEIYLMTEDHSAVMQLVKNGQLTLEEARHHEDRNVILRALGTRPSVEVSLWNEPLPVRTGDRFLVCSDGLYERVEDAEMRDIAMGSGSREACETLVRMARERGGYDNITVAIVSLEQPGASLAGAARPTRDMEVPT